MNPKIVIVCDDHRGAYRNDFTRAGFSDVTCIAIHNMNLETIKQTRAEVLVLFLPNDDKRTLDRAGVFLKRHPMAFVVFTRHDEEALISRAVNAGANAVVFDGYKVSRLQAILTAALERFKQYQALFKDAELAKTRLAERKITDRAKGILMKQRGINEDEAYQALRKIAMHQKKRIGEVAKDVVAIADIFI